MLVIVNSLKELDFRALMDIYVEGNLENAQRLWPELPEGQQLLLAEQEFYDYLRTQFFSVPGAMYALWMEQGRAVSALRLEPWKDGWLMEALETVPDARGRGCASALVQAAALGRGKVYSHVSRANGASLAVHKKCGFRKILDYAAYLDGSVNRSAVTLLLDMDKPGLGVI